jgi:hypothetical protein
MAANYQTVFGTTPISDPSTSFSTPISKKVNATVDTSIGNALVNIANIGAQSVTLANEFTSDKAEDEAEKGLTSLMIEFTQTTDYATIAKDLNVSAKLSNATLRNLRYKKLDTELKNKYKGKLSRTAIANVFKEKLGTSSPLRLIETERTNRENSVEKARIKNFNDDFDAAIKSQIQVIDPVTRRLDKEKTVQVYKTLQLTQGGISALGSSTGEGKEPDMGIFRGQHINKFVDMQEKIIETTGSKILGLLTVITNSNDPKELLLAETQLGDMISNIKLDAYALIQGKLPYQPASKREREFITGPALTIYNDLKESLGIKEGGLTNQANIERYRKTMEAMLVSRSLGTKTGQMLFSLKGLGLGEAVASKILDEMAKINSMFTDFNARTQGNSNPDADIAKSFKDLIDGVPSDEGKERISKALLLSNAIIKQASAESIKGVSEKVAKNIVNVSKKSMKFISSKNQKELLKNLSSPQGIDILKKLPKDEQAGALKLFMTEGIKSYTSELQTTIQDIVGIRKQNFENDLKSNSILVDNEGNLKFNLPDGVIDSSRVNELNDRFNTMAKFHGLTKEGLTETPLKFKIRYINSILKPMLSNVKPIKDDPTTIKSQQDFKNLRDKIKIMRKKND